MRCFLTVPVSRHAGLTSTSIGLVRALDRIGVRVAYFKPISQSYYEETEDLSTAYIRTITALDPPEPVSMDETQEMLSAGRSDDLLEMITGKYHEAAQDADVVIVEGLQASSRNQFLNSLNPELANTLNAEVILVCSANGGEPEEACENLSRRLESACQTFGGGSVNRVVAAMVNQGESCALPSREMVASRCERIARGGIALLGFVPYEPSITHVRTQDILSSLDGRVLHQGEMAQRRVTDIHLCARSLSNITHVFHAGSLVVVPADRSDIIVGGAYAALNGVQIAGLVLTGGIPPAPEILEFCRPALASGLPVLATDASSFAAAQALSGMNPEIPPDDHARIEQLADHVARNVDTDWLRQRCSIPRQPRLSPPAFRHQISKLARLSPGRIVLPEGDEPRTLKAAAICHARGLARPVLLGDPRTIRDAAAHNGVTLPAEIPIIDPADCRDRYVAPLCELRKNKNLTEQQAQSMLEDDITLATMMLAEGEVDGLVAGAVHSTADSIRPALQLIRTAPGASVVSSAFFMCLPEQVLVYSDCAVNQDPDAEQLAQIAIQSHDTARAFGIEPRVAMISYSTHGSGTGANVDKVRDATARVQELRPDILVDGPLQYDAASDAGVARTKAPDSKIKGNATVFIFPDLNTGNTTYKAVQRSGNVMPIGPVLQGMRKPVNDLSRGASVEDIVFTIAVTGIQAQQCAGGKD